MGYAVQADLIERFGTEEITDVSGDGSEMVLERRTETADILLINR